MRISLAGGFDNEHRTIEGLEVSTNTSLLNLSAFKKFKSV